MKKAPLKTDFYTHSRFILPAPQSIVLHFCKVATSHHLSHKTFKYDPITKLIYLNIVMCWLYLLHCIMLITQVLINFTTIYYDWPTKNYFFIPPKLFNTFSIKCRNLLFDFAIFLPFLKLRSSILFFILHIRIF